MGRRSGERLSGCVDVGEGADDAGEAALSCGPYQRTVGTFTAGAHPGSYNGQDAYNDLLIVGVRSGCVYEGSSRSE